MLGSVVKMETGERVSCLVWPERTDHSFGWEMSITVSFSEQTGRAHRSCDMLLQICKWSWLPFWTNFVLLLFCFRTASGYSEMHVHRALTKHVLYNTIMCYIRNSTCNNFTSLARFATIMSDPCLNILRTSMQFSF
jgi:hypothetical protein